MSRAFFCMFLVLFVILLVVNGCDDSDTIVGDPSVPDDGGGNGGVEYLYCAASIVDFAQGVTGEGKQVNSLGLDNNDPEYVLGTPDSEFQSYGTFFSMGYHGFIELKFEEPVGGSLAVYETTWGSYPEERAEVQVSRDGESWTVLGMATNGGPDVSSNDRRVTVFEFEGCIQYVRIIDKTVETLHELRSDAFDLDAVCAEFVCSSVECPIAAINVTEFSQGTKKNGDSISQERSNPDNTLGSPDGAFTSLGFGGSIILEFPDRVRGNLTVYEITRGVYPEERVEVYGSEDGETWFYIGVATSLGDPVDELTRTTTFYVEECIRYVRLVDITEAGLHGAEADGFELDAVCITEYCPPEEDFPDCIIPVDVVIEADQGTKNNGDPVNPERSDPSVVLGPPDNEFFSLGFGGSIILEFPDYVTGNLVVYETTYNDFPLETAQVFVSVDGVDWINIGYADNSDGLGTNDIHPTIFYVEDCIKYVRIIDVTDGSLHGPRADGFDLDAVCAEETCLLPTPTPTPTPPAGECAFPASSVTEFNQGNQKNGDPVNFERSDPTKALGAPDEEFVSLGFGGFIVLEFPDYVTGDISIYEITEGKYPLEKADVYVSLDGATWTFIGTADNTDALGSQDVHETTLSTAECIRYIKIVDTTDPAIHNAQADGFDLDAVCAGETCEPPEDEIEPGDFRTQTQGGWGSRCSGNNPGCYRDDHFDDCFPDGLIVGCSSGYTALFTSSEAIEAFLPAGGKSGSFSENYIDPTDTDAGVLAGQVVALSLSVGFDLCDPDFGASSIHLKDLVVVDSNSPCYGMTVQQVLDTANDVLGGCDTSTNPSQISDCATAINENFVDGDRVGNYLGLP